MKTILIFCLSLTVALTSCEKLVYINIKEGENKIVLSGLICPDSTVIVQITKSIQVSQYGPADTIPLTPKPMIVGDVNLYENDIFIGKLRQKERNYYELPGFKPSAGKSYRLEASSGKMKPVSATVVVPDLIPPSSFDTARITMDNGHPAIHVSLQITDPGGQENYYALQVTGIHRYFDYFLHKFTDSIVAYPFYAKLNGKVNDPLDLDFLDVNRDVFLDRKQIFSDQLFNGKKFDMSFDIPSEDWSMKADTVEVWIDLQQVDKSYYLYAVSEQKYQQTRNNPFTEPVQVYSNVKNGFGLFSAYNGTRKEFIVDWTR